MYMYVHPGCTFDFCTILTQKQYHIAFLHKTLLDSLPCIDIVYRTHLLEIPLHKYKVHVINIFRKLLPSCFSFQWLTILQTNSCLTYGMHYSTTHSFNTRYLSGRWLQMKSCCSTRCQSVHNSSSGLVVQLCMVNPKIDCSKMSFTCFTYVK